MEITEEEKAEEYVCKNIGNGYVRDYELDRKIWLDGFHEGQSQLTKAKTYLKYFIEILKRLRANKEPLVIEAEQFLSEVEK